MPNPLRLAADSLLALAAGLAAFGGGAAQAQDDPFALPKTATADIVSEAASVGPGPSEIEVDGLVRKRLVELKGHGAEMTIDADHARVAGLPIPDSITGMVPISSLGLYRWSFDSLRQRLVVRLFNKGEGTNFRDFARRGIENAERRTLPALRLDYVINANVSPSGLGLGGLFGASLIKGSTVAATSAQVMLMGADSKPRATRLDSFVRTTVPGTSAVATLGDFVTSASVSQRAVRLGGIQLASDFRQQPHLVTQPLPNFAGTVAVPTSVDILLGESQVKVGQLEPGEFAIRNIPATDGRGSLRVQMKDSLGRFVSHTVSFYNTDTLLKPGLASYAVNAGFVRRRYGETDFEYGKLVASAFYRRGLSPFLTMEASGESTAGLVNLGLKGDFTIGNIALASIEARGSRDSRLGTGGMVNVSLESEGRTISGRFGANIPTSRYRDVASHLGDRPPAHRLFGNLSFRLIPRLPLQLAFARQTALPADFQPNQRRIRAETLSFGTSYAPLPRLHLSLSAGIQHQERRSFFVSAGLDLKLGATSSLRGAVSRGLNQSLSAVSYSYADPERRGIRAQAAAEMLDNTPRISAVAAYDGAWGGLESSLIYADGAIGGQLTASGAVLAVDDGVHALRSGTTSYLLVRSDGVAGVPVLLDNRYVGSTGKTGKLFVANVIPHAPQTVDVDGGKLPVEAVVTEARHVVSVPAQAVGLLDIAAKLYRPVVLQIVDPKGAALAAGLRVVALPSGEATQMGYDGLVEFNRAGADTRLEIHTAAGKCAVDVTGMSADQTAPLICLPVAQIAQQEPGSAPAPLAVGPARKVARRD